MFDQLVKRSNAVWIYNTGRFADERRIFLEEMIVQGYGLRAIRIITRFCSLSRSEVVKHRKKR